MSYAATVVQGLEACPFCRELFPRGEARECPVCGVRLVSASKLPDPSAVDAGDEIAPKDAAEEVLPWLHLGHARGIMIVCAAVGLALFAMPWVHMFAPDRRSFTGIELAARAQITWSVGVAWFTLLPLVLSRRTVRDMLGARLPMAVLAAIPVVTCSLLLLRPPQGAQAHGITIPMRFTWDPAIYASLALGVIAIAITLARFGRPSGDVPLPRPPA